MSHRNVRRAAAIAALVLALVPFANAEAATAPRVRHHPAETSLLFQLSHQGRILLRGLRHIWTNAGARIDGNG
ncbi:MAG: hypothetical protein M3O15_03815 [Acidobacteriota bacterium]|nr:hypothetical protein [Acidobacteriota bacterium]